ncbi:unnamed protein product [Fraxinus pennsylvanica]|uniref:HTH La-type RNA-binding domain-containing protein n=1 Tax=Fraxinus pennsylvanica TaxID=56036 RepID=A0AAD1Z6J2_9LAMI|nr:unnamed protein product [Fraxinus pennsylvanica]
MADSPNNDHSPRSPVTDSAIAAASAAGGGVNSPQSRRWGPSSVWASVVRGDSDPISSPTAAASRSSTSPPPIAVAASEQPSASEKAPMESSGLDSQPESSNVNSDGNAGRPRRHAWNTPVNGVVEPGSVMGDAVSWPALSESTRTPRSSSEPSRPVPDGSLSSSQGPIISQPPQRQVNTNAHVNSTVNNTRQRSRNRGGGAGGGGGSGSGPSSSAFSRQAPPSPPPFPVFDMSYANVVPPMLDAPVRGTRPGGGVGGSQQHTGNDHSSPRNNSRRGNYGPRPRGDGPYHINHGGRRDQDRRNVHLSHQYVPPVGYMPSPLPPGAPFMAPPPPVRVFPGQMGFDMPSPFIYVPTLSPESFRPMQIVPPPPPVLFAPNDPLPSLIVKQIDFYFSDENLVKDNFLRSNMDDQGWVPINLIASFPRVQQLTYDVPLILDSLRNSTIVEVQGDKLRKRNEWKKWLHNASWSNTDSGPHTPGASSENVLATSFQRVSLDDATIDANGTMDGQTEMSPESFAHSIKEAAGGGEKNKHLALHDFVASQPAVMQQCCHGLFIKLVFIIIWCNLFIPVSSLTCHCGLGTLRATLDSGLVLDTVFEGFDSGYRYEALGHGATLHIWAIDARWLISRGKIILCESKDNEYSAQHKFGLLVKQGAIGLILINDERAVASTYGSSPVAVVTEEDGARILFYINSNRYSSSRSSHVSGVAATVKSLHPSWSPSAIKSVIVISR